MAPPDDGIDFKRGWSYVLTRNEKAKKIIQNMHESGSLVATSITDKEARKCNHHMASEKRWRAFRVIETHRRQGKAIPKYGSIDTNAPALSAKHFVKTEINMLTHIGCFLPKLRPYILSFALGEGGYWLLWLNNKRRRFKTWVRDSYALAKRRLFGRT